MGAYLEVDTCPGYYGTEDLLLLATAKSGKHSITITELVVVWSLCSVYKHD